MGSKRNAGIGDGLSPIKTIRAGAHWSRWWMAMWAICAPTTIVAATRLPFKRWLPLAGVLFGLPEAISVSKADDRYPPLTHMLRHFLKSWVTFPFLYFCVGACGSRWLKLKNPLGLGALTGLLGWLTDHFDQSYSGDDPFPFAHQRTDEENGVRRRRVA